MKKKTRQYLQFAGIATGSMLVAAVLAAPLGLYRAQIGQPLIQIQLMLAPSGPPPPPPFENPPFSVIHCHYTGTDPNTATEFPDLCMLRETCLTGFELKPNPNSQDGTYSSLEECEAVAFPEQTITDTQEEEEDGVGQTTTDDTDETATENPFTLCMRKEGTKVCDPGQKCAHLLRTKIETYSSYDECKTFEHDPPLAHCQSRNYDRRISNYDDPAAQLARQPQPLVQCSQVSDCWAAMGFSTPPSPTAYIRTVSGERTPSCDIPIENEQGNSLTYCNFYDWYFTGLNACSRPANVDPCPDGFDLKPINAYASKCEKVPFYHGINVIEKTIQGSVRVVVISVDPGSPADGKISVDDIITTVDSEYMYTTSQFINRMDSAPLADKIMGVYRNGQNITVSVLPTVQ